MRPNRTRTLPLLLGLALASPFSTIHARQASAGTITLPPVEVLGQDAAAVYYEGAGSGATRTDTPLREVPQAVRIVPRQVLDDVGATRLDDTLDYVSGIARQSDFGGLWDNFAIRGLAGHEETGLGFLLNGFAGNRGFNAPRDTANVERIEFLKGPAAALYGSSEPGGTVNIVTKKPRFTSAHSAEAYAGSYDLYRVAVDSTGPLSQQLAYRINAAAETRGSFRDKVDSERRLFAPALTWRAGSDTLVNYEAEYLQQKAPLDRGVIAANGEVGTVSRKRFLGEPNDGDVTVENLTHQLTLEHLLSEAWRTRFGVAYKTGSLEGYSTEARPTLVGTSLWRQRRYRDYESDDLDVQAELIGSFRTGTVEHELLTGVEAYRFALDQFMLRVNGTAGEPYAIDIHDPVYGQTPPALLPNTDTSETQRNAAWFIQDQIGLAPRWKLLAGLRVDRFDQRIENHRNGTVRKQDHAAHSPRLGLTFLATERVSVYVGTGRSFRPNAGVDRFGAAFDPETGRADEAGIKFESADGRFGAGAAVFDIRKKNVLTRDPADGSFSVAAGEVRSRGLELDAAGQVGEHWRVSASFAWIDAEVARDNDPSLEGKPLANVPRTSASALVVREVPLAGGGRFGLGGGLSYVGERAGDARDSFELPAYTTAKLLAFWRVGERLRLSLDVDNLFDREYYASAYDRWWVTPGTPRTITLGMQAKF